jgi:hypothetical protein
MTASDAVASLRPGPSGPPLWGRATLRDGIITGRPFGPPEHEKRGRWFHLKNDAQWSKIGGRRRCSRIICSSRPAGDSFATGERLQFLLKRAKHQKMMCRLIRRGVAPL